MGQGEYKDQAVRVPSENSMGKSSYNLPRLNREEKREHTYIPHTTTHIHTHHTHTHSTGRLVHRWRADDTDEAERRQ